MRRLVPIAALMLIPDAAFAHTVIPGVGGFFGGLLHPLLVPAHVLTLLALGLLAGQQSARTRRMALAIFLAGLLAGIAAIVSAFAVEDADLVLLACAASAGLLVALARPVPTLLAGMLAACTGATLALDSVPEEISMRATVLALLGTLIGAKLALTFVAGTAADRERDWQRIGMRVLGSWVAASALLVLALRLTR